MGDQISWWVELAVKSGQLDNFEALTGEMVETARRERGVLSYQRFVSEDRKCVILYDTQTRLQRWRIYDSSSGISRNDSWKW